jgi:hypothetical protein
VWVLERAYGYSRAEIAAAVNGPPLLDRTRHRGLQRCRAGPRAIPIRKLRLRRYDDRGGGAPDWCPGVGYL